MPQHLPYDVTEQAEFDLEEIFAYSEAEFGLAQAMKYVLAFEDLFMNLAGNPKLGRERTEVRKGLRSIVQGSHVVFYRVVGNRVRVIRVLHGRRDLPAIIG